MSHPVVDSGAEETKLTRENLKWPYGEFEIPQEVYDTFSNAGKKGKAAEDEWKKVCFAKCVTVAQNPQAANLTPVLGATPNFRCKAADQTLISCLFQFVPACHDNSQPSTFPYQMARSKYKP